MDVISCQNLLEYIGYEESFASAIILSIFKMWINPWNTIYEFFLLFFHHLHQSLHYHHPRTLFCSYKDRKHAEIVSLVDLLF